MNGIKYNNRAEVETAIRASLASESEPFYSKGIFDLPDRWRKTISAKGDYFID